MTDIHQNEIELDKKHQHKQMVQSLQLLRNVHRYILNITYRHMPKYFQVSYKKNPSKNILPLRGAKQHTWVFSYDKGC